MGKRRKPGFFAWILVLTLIMGGALMGWGQTASGQMGLVVGGNENVQLLQALNASWQLPEDYSLEILEVDGRVMELVQRKGSDAERAVLQLHGGAYIRSLKENGPTYRRAAVQYAELSGGVVLTPDYRTAPEHPYPAALEDALLAYNWLLDQGFPAENVIIAGDSAGGGLALALVLYLRDHELPLPAGIITMSPWTNLNYRRWKPPYVGDSPADHPYISPLYGAYHSFPPLLMQVGGAELLLGDTLEVAQRAVEARVTVQQTTYPDMFHVFQMLFPQLEEANRAWDEVGEFIAKVYRGEL